MGGFSSSSFAATAFSAAAFLFDVGAVLITPSWRTITVGAESRAASISSEPRKIDTLS